MKFTKTSFALGCFLVGILNVTLHNAIVEKIETQHQIEIGIAQDRIVNLQADLDAVQETLENESETLFWTTRLLKTTEAIADQNLDLAIESQNELQDTRFLNDLESKIRRSVQETQRRLAEIELTKAQNAHMHSVRVQDGLEDELDRVNDNYLYETGVLRDDLQSAKNTIDTLNDQMSKLLRREAELAEQLSLTRKVLSMVPRSRGVLVH